MEVAQDAYMDGTTPETYNPLKAVMLKANLRRMLGTWTGLASSAAVHRVH